MRFTAEQLYRDDEAEYNATYRPSLFGPWEETVKKYPKSVTFYTEQAVLLNALIGKPEEDDFGLIAVPVLPASKGAYLIQQWTRYGVFDTYVERHHTQDAAKLWSVSTQIEKFVVSKLYQRVASIEDDGLGGLTLVIGSEDLDLTDGIQRITPDPDDGL